VETRKLLPVVLIAFVFVLFLMAPTFAQENIIPEEETQIIEEETVEEAEAVEEEAALVEEAWVEQAVEKSCIPDKILVIGASAGGIVPFGQNIKDNYDIGIPLGIHVMVNNLAEFGGVTLNAGLETGYYMAGSSSEGDDLSGIPIYALLDFSLSNLLDFLPPEMSLCAEVAAGLHMQTAGESYNAFGLTPGLVCGYNIMEGLDLFLKIRGMEIFTGFEGGDGTQEWIDLRAGINYTLPVLLPF